MQNITKLSDMDFAIPNGFWMDVRSGIAFSGKRGHAYTSLDETILHACMYNHGREFLKKIESIQGYDGIAEYCATVLEDHRGSGVTTTGILVYDRGLLDIEKEINKLADSLNIKMSHFRGNVIGNHIWYFKMDIENGYEQNNICDDLIEIFRESGSFDEMSSRISRTGGIKDMITETLNDANRRELVRLKMIQSDK